MAVFNTNALCLAIFAMTWILLSGNNNNNIMVAGQGCQGDLQGLITQCVVYVQKNLPKTTPSPACCNVIKTVNIPCVCQRITKQVEQMIDMEKVIFVAQSCGRPVAQGTKCGSYVVPP